MRELPIEFRQAQIESGLTFDNTYAFLAEIEPATDKQTDLKETLNELIDLLGISDPEERKKHIRLLLVHGAEGRGKSYLCSGAINEILRRRYNDECNKDDPQFEDALKGRALYLTHFELDLMDKSCMNPKAVRTQIEQYNRITSIPFLVIDEIGRGSWSDYSSQNIENIISKRYAQMLPTVLITNKTIPEMVKMFDKSTRDRIFNGNTGKAIDMDECRSTSLR